MRKYLPYAEVLEIKGRLPTCWWVCEELGLFVRRNSFRDKTTDSGGVICSAYVALCVLLVRTGKPMHDLCETVYRMSRFNEFGYDVSLTTNMKSQEGYYIEKIYTPDQKIKDTLRLRGEAAVLRKTKQWELVDRSRL